MIVYTSLMLLSSPDKWARTSEIIDSQVNGQDGRSTDVVLQIMPEEEEYLPR